MDGIGQATEKKRERDDDFYEQPEHDTKVQYAEFVSLKESSEDTESNVPIFCAEIWVRILSHVPPHKRLAWMRSCKMMLEIALSCVFPPWANGGNGLIAACVNGWHEYYAKWSAVAGKKWDLSTRITQKIVSKYGHTSSTMEVFAIACEKGFLEIVKRLLMDERLSLSLFFQGFYGTLRGGAGR